VLLPLGGAPRRHYHVSPEYVHRFQTRTSNVIVETKIIKKKAAKRTSIKGENKKGKDKRGRSKEEKTHARMSVQREGERVGEMLGELPPPSFPLYANAEQRSGLRSPRRSVRTTKERNIHTYTRGKETTTAKKNIYMKKKTTIECWRRHTGTKWSTQISINRRRDSFIRGKQRYTQKKRCSSNVQKKKKRWGANNTTQHNTTKKEAGQSRSVFFC
jgi:hypothetical protein